MSERKIRSMHAPILKLSFLLIFSVLISFCSKHAVKWENPSSSIVLIVKFVKLMANLLKGFLSGVTGYIKKIIVFLIKIYQKLAPQRLRASCLFEPSCSEYTILSIEKYGIFKGIKVGMKRVLRCHPPNGGKDFP